MDTAGVGFARSRGSKAGCGVAARRSETLDARVLAIRWSMAGCGAVLHPAMETRARPVMQAWRVSKLAAFDQLEPHNMTEKLFEAALGIATPWFVAGVDFDAPGRTLSIRVDFKAGSRFAVPGSEGLHPVHDTLAKRYRHLNFFEHECFLEVRTPRVKLPDGWVRQVEPDWSGKLAVFTLMFEALVLALCRR